MMKQPDENSNATPEEIAEAQARARPLPRQPDYEEIASVAKELSAARGESSNSAEQDWLEAEAEVIRRRAATTGLPQPRNPSDG